MVLALFGKSMTCGALLGVTGALLRGGVLAAESAQLQPEPGLLQVAVELEPHERVLLQARRVLRRCGGGLRAVVSDPWNVGQGHHGRLSGGYREEP